jgi:hypothetical protein
MSKLLLTTALSGLMMSAAFSQAPPPAPGKQPDSSVVAPAPAERTAPAKGTNETPVSGAKAQDRPKSADTAASESTSTPRFVTAQSSNQWVVSKFNGTDVIGSDNKKIGDITDILFDETHKITAYVVGVGGFLGIGEKNVAIEPEAFHVWRDSKDPSTDPNKIKLKVTWTKEQIENAPSFEYYKAPASTASNPRPTTTGSAPMGSRNSSGR